MKITKIIIVIAIIIGIGVVISFMLNMDTYSNFSQAKKTPNKEQQIIGTLNKKKPVKYDTVNTTVYFTFFMLDDQGTEMKVFFKDSRPQDFEKLQQVVVTGQIKNSAFYASKMLLKCPSKYNSNKIPEKYDQTEYKTQ
ncbi:MAG: cytochrome c maturation protein CcmE [Bacteroidota bacterium]